MRYKESFLSYLRYEKRYSKHTLVSYDCDLSQFFSFLSSYGIEESEIVELNFKDVRKWIVFLMNDGCSARTVNRKLSSLKSFFKYLLRESMIQQNPMDRVVGPRQGKKLPNFTLFLTLDILISGSLVATK